MRESAAIQGSRLAHLQIHAKDNLDGVAGLRMLGNDAPKEAKGSAETA